MLRALAAAGLVAGWVILGASPASAYTDTYFTDPDSGHTTTVPAGSCLALLQGVGGTGGAGSGGATGGQPGYVYAFVEVAAGDVIEARTGEGGYSGAATGAGGVSGGHASGGAAGDAGSHGAGGGGGASVLLVNDEPVVIAAGGGGGGVGGAAAGGGGGNTGFAGSGGAASGGGGGTQSAPGSGGTPSGVSGVGGVGGAGGLADGAGGGGGGGGRFAGGGGGGGSGGVSGGGGGGSNLVPDVPVKQSNTDSGEVGDGWTRVAIFNCMGAPTGLSLTPHNGSAGVSFTAATAGEIEAPSGYQVKIGNGAWTTLTTQAGAGGTRTATLTGLTNGTEYEVQVRAVGVYGSHSPASSTQTVTPAPTVPDAPTGLTATPGNGSASLVFTPPVDNGGSAITGYEVKIDDGSWTSLPTSAGAGGTTTATLTGLTNGTTYAIRVRAVNAIGAGAAVGPASVTPVPDPPGAPTSLTATRGDTSASLVFTPPVSDGGSAITGYEVKIDDGSWAALTTAAGAGGTRTATVSSLSNGTAYAIRVRAVNVAGGGTASDPASVTPATVPDAPTGLTATRGDGSAALEFTPPADTGGSTITGYQVKVDDGSWTSLVLPAGVRPMNGGSVTATVSGLSNGTTYEIRVRAVNAVGSGAASDPASVTPATVPDAPTGLTVTRGNTTASLVFTPPVWCGGDAITGYEVSTDDGSTWSALTTASGEGQTLTGTVTGLTNGTTYQVKVRAVNTVGAGAASTAASVTPATVPGAPTSLVATAGNGSATLTFVPPVSNGGSQVTGYQASAGNDTWVALETTTMLPGSRIRAQISTRTGTLLGLTNGTTYQVKVRAVNSVGAGAASTAASVTPKTVPAAPTSVTATPGNLSATVRFTPPTDTGGSAITGYQVQVGGGSWQTLDTTSGGGQTLTGTVGSLANGLTFQLKVRAVNSVGGGTASDAVSVTAGAPLAPIQVGAVAGTSSILATWSAPPDNGVTVTGYVVTASPGPATCTTTGALSCVLGGVAGTGYTVTVVAYSGAIPSAAGGPSNAVVPVAPPVTNTPPSTDLDLTTDQGDIENVDPGEEITFIGTGYAPFSTVVLTVYSTPTVLGTVVTDANGNFTLTVTVPSNLAVGEHTVVASGVDPSGVPHIMSLAVTVPAGAPLASTGPVVASLVVAGLATMVTGAGLYAAGGITRRPARGRR